MFHRIIFLLLIISRLSCNFNRLSVPFVFIVPEHRLQELTQNAAIIKHFLRLQIVIKPLNKKNKHNEFFIMLKRNSI